MNKLHLCYETHGSFDYDVDCVRSFHAGCPLGGGCATARLAIFAAFASASIFSLTITRIRIPS